MPIGSVFIRPEIDDKEALKDFDEFVKKVRNHPIPLNLTPDQVRLRHLGGMVGDIGKALDKTSFRNFHKNLDKIDKKMKLMSKDFIKKFGTKAGKAGAWGVMTAYDSIAQARLKENYDRGSGYANEQMSTMQDTTSGGYASTINSQLKLLKGVKDGVKGLYTNWKTNRYNNLVEEQKKYSQAPPGSDPNNPPVGSGPGNNPLGKGELTKKFFAGIPFFEGLAKVAGFLVQTTSTLGQKYISSINTQQGTLGATNGYVASGSSYFSSADIARAMVEYGKTTGQYGFDVKKGILRNADRNITGSGLTRNADGSYSESASYGPALGSLEQYAAQQNLSISQFASTVGEFRKLSKDIGAGWLKGAAEASKITGLQQGEFLTAFGGYLKQLRQTGFAGTDIKGFAGLTAAMGTNLSNAGLSPLRSTNIMQNMDQKVRQGTTGGLFGSLAIMNRLKKGGDLFDAIGSVEKGVTSDDISFSSSVIGNNKLMGYLMKKEGISTYNEGRQMFNLKPQNITKHEIGTAGENIGLSAQNKMTDAMVNEAGAAAANAAVNIQAKQLELLNQMSGTLKLVAEGIGKVETAIYEKVGKGVNNLVDYLKK